MTNLAAEPARKGNNDEICLSIWTVTNVSPARPGCKICM